MRSTRARVALSLFLWLAAVYGASAQHMQTHEYSPTPFGFTRFCLQKPERCIPSRRHIMQMDKARWSELDAVNTLVNRTIVPDEDGSIIRPWRDARGAHRGHRPRRPRSRQSPYGIVAYSRLLYRWHKRMTPENPQYWRRVISWLRSNPEPPFCGTLPVVPMALSF